MNINNIILFLAAMFFTLFAIKPAYSEDFTSTYTITVDPALSVEVNSASQAKTLNVSSANSATLPDGLTTTFTVTTNVESVTNLYLHATTGAASTEALCPSGNAAGKVAFALSDASADVINRASGKTSGANASNTNKAFSLDYSINVQNDGTLPMSVKPSPSVSANSQVHSFQIRPGKCTINFVLAANAPAYNFNLYDPPGDYVTTIILTDTAPE